MEKASACQTVALVDVEGARLGDEPAFTRLVEATCVLVSSIALAIVRDPDVSRDIAQDVFLAAWHDIGKLREPSSFLPWLRQITRNRAHHVLRTSRRRRRVAENEAGERLEAVVDGRPDVGQELIAEERRRAVADTIDLLPEQTREVITLFYREGQSVAQVASLLDLSEAAVRQRLSRARLRLRDELLDRFGHDLVVTAPGSAFVAAVATAISVGAPAVASAAAIAAGGAKTVGPFAKVAGLWLGGAALGAAGGVLGVVLGLRHLESTPYDDEERRALIRLKLVAVATTIAGAGGISVGLRLTHSAIGPIVVFSLFVLSLAGIYQIWLPRILRRRYDAEMRADPILATAKRRSERRMKALGWSLGLLFGLGGLLAGLRSGGLL